MLFRSKAPGGIAYRCSFRVTEAAYLIERLVENLALETGIDAAEIRRRNFIKPEQFPYQSPMGWEYDSGDYEKALDLALELVGYDELRKEQAEKRGVKVALYLEYESGNRDFGAIAARVKEANADFLWVGSLGLESNLLLESLRKLDYTPKSHFHLYPAPGPLALSPDGDKALCSTFLEPDEPFMSRPGMKRIAAEFKERATKANLPYTTIDAQACGMVSEWQILEAGVNGAGSLDDEKIAAWLKKNTVETGYGKLRFEIGRAHV